jgi:sterol-4alpha-carboxylate 3-dehydrogenase (decarboxylating)
MNDVNEKETKKAAAEKLVLAADRSIKTCAIRTHGVVGTLDQNLFPLVAASPRGISLGPGKNLYDFSSADNVAQAHVLALENLLSADGSDDGSANRRAFFVSDGTPKPFRTLQEMIWRAVDESEKDDEENEHNTKSKSKRPKKQPGSYTVIPVWLFAGVIRFVRLLGAKTQISPQEIGDAVSQRYYDISLAKKLLGYDPEKKTLEESIGDACRWWREEEKNRK